jgi:hypothetical protein
MEDLSSVFSYDKETGVIWNLERNKRAGSENRLGCKRYRIIRHNRKKIKEHWLAFYLVTGEWPKQVVDHIDGNGCNNKWSNLRLCTQSENNRNKAIQKNNSSGICGVHICGKTGKWRSEITKDKKRYRLGFFDNLLDACAARKSKEIDLGFHKNHGRARICP